MQFNHDNMTGVLLAADMVNLGASADWCAGPVQALLRSHGIRRPDVTQAQCAALRGWAWRLREVFTAPDAGARCGAINELLGEGAARVFLTTHDGLRPHLHFTPDDNDVVARVMAVTAGGLALFTVESGGQRLATCARPGCGTVFVDTSRNGRRAYCCARCGNHDAVRRHRSGRRAAASPA